MERLVEQDAGIGQLRRGEQSFFRMPGNLASYRMRERAETDYRNAFKYATAKGMAQGRAEGEAKGRAEGRAEGMEETAAAMLREKIDILLVSRVTGLSLDRLKALQTRTES